MPTESVLQKILPNSVATAGVVYAASGTCYTFLNTGSAWQAFYKGIPAVIPDASQFNWVAQGSATVSNAYGVLTISQPELGNVNQFASQVVSSSRSRFTLDIALEYTCLGSVEEKLGVILRDSSTGKMIFFGILLQSTEGSPNSMIIARWTQPNSGNATFNSNVSSATKITDTLYLRVVNDGTNLNYYVGSSPFEYTLMFQESNSAWVATIDQIGFCASNEIGNGSNLAASCFSFLLG